MEGVFKGQQVRQLLYAKVTESSYSTTEDSEGLSEISYSTAGTLQQSALQISRSIYYTAVASESRYSATKASGSSYTKTKSSEFQLPYIEGLKSRYSVTEASEGQLLDGKDPGILLLNSSDL